MKEIRLEARLSAYSKVEAVSCVSPDLEEMTKCDVDRLFGDDCNHCSVDTPVTSNKNNLVTREDIDALFR